MAQTQEVRGVKTIILVEDGITKIVYRGNCVVAFDDKKISLNSNGWRTATTKTRMVQASNQFKLGFYVYQRDFEWFVDLPNGETVEYYDHMTFDRKEAK
jgi:hypothetical protein